MIIENVTKNSFQKNIIIGVEDLHPESFIDLQYVVKSETNRMEAELLKAVNNTQGHVDYITEKGFSYHFRISYNGMLSTMQTMNPYEIARLDKYKFLNYCNKLLDTDYSFLTFVVNPWFNRQILELGDFTKFYYRSVSRRVFVEFKNDTTPAYLYFKDIANNSITLGDISSNIAGILFIEDKSIETDDDGILYKGYLYLNPNYKNKRPLTIFDFSLSFENLPISKMMEIDDFREDNY